MAVKNQQAILNKLKKQVRVLRKKEEQARNKLRAALRKARKLGQAYRAKLTDKVQKMQRKNYADAAAGIERRLKKSLQAKGKSIALAVKKLEREYIAKLAEDMVKEKRKVKKIKKKTQDKSKSVKSRQA